MATKTSNTFVALAFESKPPFSPEPKPPRQPSDSSPQPRLPPSSRYPLPRERQAENLEDALYHLWVLCSTVDNKPQDCSHIVGVNQEFVVFLVGIKEEIDALCKGIQEGSEGGRTFKSREEGEGLVVRVGFPGEDEVVEGVVANEVFGFERLHGGRAGVVTVVEPDSDARAIIGDAGAKANRGFNPVQGCCASDEA